MFVSDLIKEIKLPLAIDFMAVSSYGNSTKSSGVVKIIKDLDDSIEGKDVLIVEDIVDSGLTLAYLLDNLESRDPNSIEICTLLDKPTGRKTDVDTKYVGFEIKDDFVVGYGLDYAEKYRNVPHIFVLKEEVYQ
jgi:hypoxanthine phosphoribosyltransferase